MALVTGAGGNKLKSTCFNITEQFLFFKVFFEEKPKIVQIETRVKSHLTTWPGLKDGFINLLIFK